jgi:hypothetical protein
MMTVKEIIKEKLTELGADGLCNEECGCSIHALVPCFDDFSGCVPAMATVATAENADEYDCDVGDQIFIPQEPEAHDA